MSDRELAIALTQAKDTERLARAQWEHQQRDPAERDAALAAMRHVIALRRCLESWVSDRACRAVAS